MPEPFHLDPDPDADPFRRSLLRVAGPAVGRALKLPALNRVYADSVTRDAPFADAALDVLNIGYDLADDALGRVPPTGPLVVVANHPFGGIEGLILASLLRRVRPDVKLLANRMLRRIPELRDSFFFVDVFDTGPDATRRNAAALRRAVAWVGGGHTLGVFPAGEVSHLAVRERRVIDPPWSPAVARIVERTGATVLPVYFDGRNSTLFQLAGLIHPRLRSAMLPRELFRRRRSTVPVHVGRPIPPERSAKLADRRELTDFLRVRTYLLDPRARGEGRSARDDADLPPPPDGSAYQPVAPPESPDALAAELARLPPDQTLLTTADHDVVFARRDQLDAVMREIGRLREIAFRQVHEGTGQPRDLDRFDDHYLHLIAWHRTDRRVVGAYRLGLTDRILATHGKRGLYSHTLFHYRTRLIEEISPAIEMGRSFVNPLDQRSFQPLLLLWKGIGAYTARYPRYVHLFGPVSISAQYSSMSKRLLIEFLEMHRFLPSLAKQIRARNPPPRRRGRSRHDAEATRFTRIVRDLDEVNALIGELEADGKTMPVLMRQYLKLNGRFLGFNVDPEFGNVVDGLVLVDLRTLPKAVGDRYWGKGGAAAYRAHHSRV